jgi:hypothetical protein
VSSGAVQLEAGDAAPATRQGDLSLYSDDALEGRGRLRASKGLMKAVQQVWKRGARVLGPFAAAICGHYRCCRRPVPRSQGAPPPTQAP